MKKQLLIAFAVLSIATAANAQTLPNGAMENWQSIDVNNPNNWNSSNTEWRYLNGVFPTTKSSDSRSGSAIKLETIRTSYGDTVFGFFANTDGDPIEGEGGQPFSQIPQNMTGYYKSNVQPGDSALMIVFFKKNGVLISQSMYKFGGTQNTYTAFSFPIQNLSVTPDSVIIAAASSNAIEEIGIVPGSWIMFDDLALTGTGVTQTITNGNFDNWTTNTYDLLNEWNSEYELKKVTGYKGLSAVQLETTQYEGGWIEASSIRNFSYDRNTGDRVGGTPYTKTNDTLLFWYKYVPAGTDSAQVSIELRSGGNTIDGRYMRLGAAANYTKVAIPLQTANTPEILMIRFESSSYDGGQITVAGSKLTIDEVQLASTPLNTGLKNIFKNSASIGLYPNPASSVAVIQTNNKGAINYSLNDITGKVVLTGTGNEINLSNLNNGIYFVTVKSGTEVIAVKKLIKE